MNMRKRFKYSLIDSIIGMDFEYANKLCLFNGYNLGGNVKFWSIDYKLDDKNKIIEVKFL